MSFLRHGEIFRSDRGVEPGAGQPPPVGRRRARVKERGRSASWLIVSMSLQLAIPRRVALQQSPLLFHQLFAILQLAAPAGRSKIIERQITA
jgi:hypothetical protein